MYVLLQNFSNGFKFQSLKEGISFKNYRYIYILLIEKRYRSVHCLLPLTYMLLKHIPPPVDAYI